MWNVLRLELRRFANTVTWSWQGWRAAWATQKSLRQWTLVNVISAALSFCVQMSAAERGLILALGVLVLAAELINTAIEQAIDYISEAKHPRAKMAKDCGSAAVALTAIAAGVAWLVILIG